MTQTNQMDHPLWKVQLLIDDMNAINEASNRTETRATATSPWGNCNKTSSETSSVPPVWEEYQQRQPQQQPCAQLQQYQQQPPQQSYAQPQQYQPPPAQPQQKQGESGNILVSIGGLGNAVSGLFKPSNDHQQQQQQQQTLSQSQPSSSIFYQPQQQPCAQPQQYQQANAANERATGGTPVAGGDQLMAGPTLVPGAALRAQRVNPQSFLNHGVPLREHRSDRSYYSHGVETEQRLASMVSTLEPVGEAPPYTRYKKEPLFSQWFHNALRECVVDILSTRIPVPTNAALDATLSTRPTNPHGYETTFPLGSSLSTSVVRAHFMTKFFADGANLNQTSEVLFKLFHNHLHPWKGGGGAPSSHYSTEFGQEYHCWLTEEHHKEQYRRHDSRLLADLFIPGEVRISLLPKDASFDVDLSASPVNHLLEAIVKSHVLTEFKQEGRKLEIRQTLPAPPTLVGGAPLEEQNVNNSSPPSSRPKSSVELSDLRDLVLQRLDPSLSRLHRRASLKSIVMYHLKKHQKQGEKQQQQQQQQRTEPSPVLYGVEG